MKLIDTMATLDSYQSTVYIVFYWNKVSWSFLKCSDLILLWRLWGSLGRRLLQHSLAQLPRHFNSLCPTTCPAPHRCHQHPHPLHKGVGSCEQPGDKAYDTSCPKSSSPRESHGSLEKGGLWTLLEVLNEGHSKCKGNIWAAFQICTVLENDPIRTMNNTWKYSGESSLTPVTS